ncbi:MAG: ectonucleotide pyrophosphatase/phosphodiesterase [Lysobacterales bacterium]|jgi:hypothetical protein
MSRTSTKYRLFALFLLLFLSACAAPPLKKQAAPDTPYLVLVSMDGFRWDYHTLTETPNLDRMASKGMKAEALRPVFPTITFPNHYSIATGVYPWRHGIVANEFPREAGGEWYVYKNRSAVQDGSWYLSEPVWVTAEKAGLRTAAFYFVGTEADIDGVRPADWRSFDAEVPAATRVDTVLGWLSRPEAERPHLVTLYFENVDSAGHWYGPESPENREVMRLLDQQLGRLLDGIAALPHGERVNVLLVSDHGQSAYADREPFILENWIKLDDVKTVGKGAFVYLYYDRSAKNRVKRARDAINGNWDCGRAYLPDELPPSWNAGTSPRYPDLFVQSDPGCAVAVDAKSAERLLKGDHGWSPEMPEMGGIFYAMGPRIPVAARVGVVSVVDVYPMMLEILGLAAPGPVDGDPDVLASRLLPEKR